MYFSQSQLCHETLLNPFLFSAVGVRNYEPKFAEVGVTKKHRNLQTDIIDFYCNAVTALHFAKTSCVALLSPKGLILARVEIKQV